MSKEQELIQAYKELVTFLFKGGSEWQCDAEVVKKYKSIKNKIAELEQSPTSVNVLPEHMKSKPTASKGEGGKNIFLITSGSHDDYQVHRAYSNRLWADTWVDSRIKAVSNYSFHKKGYYSVEEIELNPPDNREEFEDEILKKEVKEQTDK